MNDFDSAAWSSHHGQWSGWLASLFSDTAIAFRRLQAQRFDAPWRPRAARPRRDLAC